ncbi:MAG: hypothetical protein ISQ08_12285 [Planctomycetes bacterium]|nr:hypothetical protein [Planctomycetota bacterium]
MARTAMLLLMALALATWGVVTGTRTPLPLPMEGALFAELRLDPWRAPLRPRGPEDHWRVAQRRGGQVVLELVADPAQRRTVAWAEVLAGRAIPPGP